MTLIETAIPPAGEICSTPNAQAPPPKITFEKHAATIRGYQNFSLLPRGPVPSARDIKLLRKFELLAPWFTPAVLRGRSFLDLGANAGFFCFWALHSGAATATAVEMDHPYVALMEEASKSMKIQNLDIRFANIADHSQRADVVTAFALVHWLYSCSSTFGSLEAVIAFLANLTNDLLLIEWIAPEDAAIASFKHTEFNAACVTGPYSFSAFQAALQEHFEQVQPIGHVESTRKLFAAWKSRRRQLWDMSCPLPMIYPAEQMLSSRRLTPAGGANPVWSRVYDLGDRIVKQATGSLAAREAEFLSELRGDLFPRIISVSDHFDYSVLIEEKIAGAPLDAGHHNLAENPEAFLLFARGCLNILGHLRERGIVHRDILPGNVFLRDGHPVLLDFGWAQKVDRPVVTPHDLGRGLRPPDGTFCDLYSMGKLLAYACQNDRHPAQPVIALMTNQDPDLRVMDLPLLENLFVACIQGAS